ncbi:MAG: hypothetical protein EA343_23490 [Nodularia sp. (in: Bacteria)]|nr:MAG: hypothetical protein EA343_23490 [Nodularia sp. (in: cyanobacteria)]
MCWRFVKRIISRKGAKTQRKIRYFGLKTPKFFVLIVDLPSIFICLTLAIFTLLGNETALPLLRGTLRTLALLFKGFGGIAYGTLREQNLNRKVLAGQCPATNALLLL